MFSVIIQAINQPSRQIMTKFGQVGGIERVTIRGKFDFDWFLIDAGSAGSWNFASLLQKAT